VYVFGGSFATVSRLRFGAMPRNYRETKRSWQTKEALQYCYEGVRLSSWTAAVEWGRPKVRSPFYSAALPIIPRLTNDFTLLPQHANLLMVTSLREIHIFLSANTVRTARGSSEAHIRLVKNVRKFGPSKERDGPH
jgi:hypothetical protein